MFLPKKKGDVFFPARKAADERWGVVLPAGATLLGWPNYGVDGRLNKW
jgi:hypothetical protein